MKKYQSWGLYPKDVAKNVKKIYWRYENTVFDTNNKVLPYGLGRSYGDVCLNKGGTLIDTTELNHFINFDKENGLLKCESGTTLEQVLELIVPYSWFLPVTPGTKFVTIGGAIANDVHGKNHHKAGSFGHFVNNLELLRSDGKTYFCSKKENLELLKSTIGGLGLTGLILTSEISLKKIESEYLYLETLKFKSIDEFFEINDNSEKNFEYTVAWLDCTNGGANSVRGIYQRANHIKYKSSKNRNKSRLKIPFVLPFSIINQFTNYIFNFLYYSKQFEKIVEQVVHYDKFFFPLDGVGNWNFLYGKKGFLQYQFVIPKENCKNNLITILNEFKKEGLTSFLAVLKTFGNFPKAGKLSFSRNGLTLAIDFPITSSIFRALEKIDEMIIEFGGAIYPAKDARMKSKTFQISFPELREFVHYKDPMFTSSFWERVNQNLE